MWGLHTFTLLEGVEKTRQLGLSYVCGLSFQKVSADIPQNFDADLTDAQLEQIRLQMDAAGVRMPVCFYATIPGDEAGCRKVFEFGRKMGIETFISEPPRGIARRDRALLRRIRHQACHPQSWPGSIARLLATGRGAGSLPGAQQTHRRLSRHGLLDPLRASIRSRASANWATA